MSYDAFETFIGLAARWLANQLAARYAFFAVGPINYAVYYLLSLIMKWLFKKTSVEFNVRNVETKNLKKHQRLRQLLKEAKAIKFKDADKETLEKVDNDFESAFKDFIRM